MLQTARLHLSNQIVLQQNLTPITTCRFLLLGFVNHQLLFTVDTLQIPSLAANYQLKVIQFTRRVEKFCLKNSFCETAKLKPFKVLKIWNSIFPINKWQLVS